MLSIKFLREHAEQAKQNAIYRGVPDAPIDEALAVDADIRELQKQTQSLRHQRNTLSKAINEAKKQGKQADDIIAEAKAIPDKIKSIEDNIATLQSKLNELLLAVPNIAHKDVPQGASDKDNVVISTHGNKPTFDFEVKNHAEIAEHLGIAEFDAATRVAGKGFFYLQDDLALLNQALIHYAIQQMIAKGYRYIEPPLFVREEVLRGVYSAVDIEQQSYKIEGEDLYLIATSEHPLIGMFAQEQIPHTALPIKLTGYSQCFRKEIGSHGLDEKGLFRTHQFNKVEQIIICHPDESWQFFDELLNNSKQLLSDLQLPYRVNEMCTGDLGLMKARQFDVEVYSPRKDDYIEVCSCSNLTDNQALLLGIRVQHHDGNFTPHTLNNTAIATSRIMVAILENNQTKDGSVIIPQVLRPFMGGKELITK